MADWNHASESDDRTTPVEQARNARVGLRLFALYLVFYTGFMLISAFAPAAMAWRPAAEINLAIWYGVALIGGALVLALVYSWLCRGRDGA